MQEDHSDRDYPSAIIGCELRVQNLRQHLESLANQLVPRVRVLVQIMPYGQGLHVVLVRIPEGDDLVSSRGRFLYRGGSGNVEADTRWLRNFFRAELARPDASEELVVADHVLRREPGRCRLNFLTMPLRTVRIEPSYENKDVIAHLLSDRGYLLVPDLIEASRIKLVFVRIDEHLAHEIVVGRSGYVLVSRFNRVPKSWSERTLNPISLPELKADMHRAYLCAGDLYRACGFGGAVKISVEIDPCDVVTLLTGELSSLIKPEQYAHVDLSKTERNLERGRWKRDEAALAALEVSAGLLDEEHLDALIDKLVDEICRDYRYAGEKDLFRGQRLPRRESKAGGGGLF